MADQYTFKAHQAHRVHPKIFCKMPPRPPLCTFTPLSNQSQVSVTRLHFFWFLGGRSICLYPQRSHLKISSLLHWLPTEEFSGGCRQHWQHRQQWQLSLQCSGIKWGKTRKDFQPTGEWKLSSFFYFLTFLFFFFEEIQKVTKTYVGQLQFEPQFYLHWFCFKTAKYRFWKIF